MALETRSNFEWPAHLAGEPSSSSGDSASIRPENVHNKMEDKNENMAGIDEKNGAFEDLEYSKSSLPPRPETLSLNKSNPVKFRNDIQQKTSLKRRPRVENLSVARPRIDENELMREETKLVVLEYLSSLPPNRIKARARHSQNQVVKAQTIHSSERPFLEYIEKKKNQTAAAALSRRNSEQYDDNIREKLRSMAVPLRKKLTPEVSNDIASFDKNKLKKSQPHRGGRGGGRGGRPIQRKLSLLRLSTCENQNSPDTPTTCVTVRLEEMSKEIMKDYPQLLDEHLSELLDPLDSGEKLSYDKFASVAKTVFEKQLARFTGSIWTKVAMVFYLVKEVVFSGGLSDIQVEVLVEYATRFISEHSMEPIRNEGGWGALELHDDVLVEGHDLHRYLSNPSGDDGSMDDVDGPRRTSSSSWDSSPEEPNAEGYFQSARNAVTKLTTYGAAALAVGIGVAYSYLKQQ